MASAYLLAYDLGTSSLKAALTTTTGDVIDGTAEPLSVSFLPGGGAEQDPEDWWRALVTVTRRLLGSNGVRPEDVVAVNVGAQWSGTVAVDGTGTPLHPAIIWMDSRGAEHVRRVTGGFPRVEGYGLGRLITWIRKTGGAPGHSGKDPIAHILFLKDELPEVYERTRTFLEPKDWLNLRLSGVCAASHDSITLHWVTDCRDIRNIRYDDRLLRLSRLDREKLPDLVPTASVIGNLTPQAAADLGLTERTQVVSGMGDLLAAAIGSGAVRDFDAHLCIGTSSWLVCHVPYKKTDLLHNMASLPSAIPGRYLLANEQESAGVCLVGLKDRILYPGDPRPSDRIFDEMLAEAAAVAAGSEGLLFTPWLNGERTPVDDHLVRGGFFNQGLEHGRPHMVRAVLEGVACNTRWLLKYVERFIKRRLPAVTAVGGGARSDLWCQIHADVLDRPVLQARDPMLTNARGAAFQAAVALGELSFDDIPERVPIRRAYEPNPATRATYDRLFDAFLSLYKSSRKISARLSRRD